MCYQLIDLRGFIIRSYFSGTDPDAFDDAESSKPVNTAGYGFENFFERYMLKWLELAPPHKMLFTLEGGNDFRKGIHPEYKATRGQEQSEAVKNQLALLQGKVEATLADMGFILCQQPGAEADDLLSYLSINLKGSKIVHTVDQDLLVLSSLKETSVCYYAQRGDEEFYSDGKLDGLPAKFLTLKKSIVGDSSDNYKGVPGFGPKAWDKLVEAYGESGLSELNRMISNRLFDELDADAAELGDKLIQKLSDQKQDWYQSYQLAKLYPSLCNSVIGRKLNKIKWICKVPEIERFDELLGIFDGNEAVVGWLTDLMPSFKLMDEHTWGSAPVLEACDLEDTPFVAWDYESYDPDNHQQFLAASKKKYFVDVINQEVVGCSFALGPLGNRVYYFPVNHADTSNLPKDSIIEAIKRVEASGKEMVAQNSQFEASLTLTNFGHKIKYMTDTAMYAKNLYESESSGLKQLSKVHLGYDQQTYEQTLGEKQNMSQLTGQEVLSYACDDSLVTAKLYNLFTIQAELEGTSDFIHDYDCESLHLLVDGFVKGFPIDEARLQELADKDKAEHDRLLSVVHDLLAENCSQTNPDASSVLYKELEDYTRLTLREKGKSKTEIQAKLDDLKESILEASRYIEPRQIKPEPDFVPTVLQINKVLQLAGVELELVSVSQTAVTNLMIEAEMKKVRHPVLQALGGCAGKQLKTRAGREYEVFEQVCKEVLTEAVQPVTIGTELNLDSPKQMTHLLYAMLGLPIRMRTKVTTDSARDKMGLEGGPSANEKAMQVAAAEDCSGPNEWKRTVLLNIIEINKCRTRSKLYWTPYPLWVHPKDGMIHASINQSATVTNRPTGTSPNVLQVSKKDGGHVRSIFVPGQGYAYISIDFAGQELRITASETKDPVMLDAYIGDEPKDLHTVTACAIAKPMIDRIFKGADTSELVWDGSVLDYKFFRKVLEADEKTPTLSLLKKVRAAAKTLNFGVVYGAGAMGISTQLMIPYEVAQALIDALFSRYKRLPDWKEEVWEFARTHGYVETAYGSRRHCWPDIISKDGNLRSRMERQVCNFAVQGCAADILKIVLTNAHQEHVFRDTGAIMLAPIYDEIAARVPVDNAVEYINRMSHLMAVKTPGHQVPQVPEVSIGRDNWGYQKELGAFPSDDMILTELGILEKEAVSA